jgi:hypothetical protein
VSRKKRLVSVVIGAAALVCVAAASAIYMIEPAIVDSGGGHAESASYEVEVSIGGPVIVTGAAQGQTASSPSYTCEVGGVSVAELGKPPPAPAGGGDDGGCVPGGASPVAALVALGVLLFARRRHWATRT